MTLTFDLAGHCDCPSYGSWYIIRVPSCQFWWYYDYSFLIYWPCDIDLWRWRSWRLWLMRSSSSMRVPSLKFVGLAIPKIWRTMCVSINGPGDLDLWPFDLETVCESHLRWGTFLPNLGTLGLWVCELCAMYVTDRRTDKSNAIKSNVIRGRGHNNWVHRWDGVCERNQCSQPVRWSVRLSVTKLVNTIFWKQLNRFWCCLAWVVHGTRAKTIFGVRRSGGQGHTRMNIYMEAYVAEASFSAPLDWVGFLVLPCNFVALKG